MEEHHLILMPAKQPTTRAIAIRIPREGRRPRSGTAARTRALQEVVSGQRESVKGMQSTDPKPCRDAHMRALLFARRYQTKFELGPDDNFRRYLREGNRPGTPEELTSPRGAEQVAWHGNVRINRSRGTKN